MLKILDLNCRNNGIGTLNLHWEFILELLYIYLILPHILPHTHIYIHVSLLRVQSSLVHKIMHISTYLLLNLDISSLAVGILRLPCIVSSVTYQGASIKDVRVFYWNRWRISMLELLAVPHSSIPQVQTGLDMAINEYVVNLSYRRYINPLHSYVECDSTSVFILAAPLSMFFHVHLFLWNVRKKCRGKYLVGMITSSYMLGWYDF